MPTEAGYSYTVPEWIRNVPPGTVLRACETVSLGESFYHNSWLHVNDIVVVLEWKTVKEDLEDSVCDPRHELMILCGNEKVCVHNLYMPSANSRFESQFEVIT